MLATFLLGACASEKVPTGGGVPSSLSSVPSVRLNYRYEADVPPPETTEKTAPDERNAAVQADFDQNRPQELIERTLASPDSKRLLVVYNRTTDLPDEFRLDMYSADGNLLRKITSDLMAVHFPDTIRWSPDSSTLAFVAMLRGVSTEPEQTGPGGVELVPASTPPANTGTNTDANVNANIGQADGNANVDSNAAPAAPTPESPTGILTFRTEQLYICDAEGSGTKPITQNEGFIYFYYVWAPDSSMLASLALHSREWNELKRRADASASVFVPQGRPRIVEKSGRERRVDDALTAVQPVWSPDSSKIATGFDTQVRIYDALGNNPTQAALPLRNSLLLSAQAYDQTQAQQLNADANQQPANANVAPSTLPDASTLVSFNPIVQLNWSAPELLYFQTAYIRRMKNEADSATSFVRWHRLILTPQPTSN